MLLLPKGAKSYRRSQIMEDNKEQNKITIVHPGGNPEFWSDERVKKYDYHQSLIVEQKEEMLSNIVRIVNYFYQARSMDNPKVLDVGCGPGTLSTRILERIPDSLVFGIDSSEEMIDAANKNLSVNRFFGYVGNFNTNEFWLPEIDITYDFIVSSIALHYLSDERREPFFREVYNHLGIGGVFVASIGVRSEVSEIAQMTDYFATQFLHQQLEKERGPQDFEEVRKRGAEANVKANINWHSTKEYINSLYMAGFKKADLVWHLWIKSIFVALK
jgi:SAM-dependent methyltransferase